MIYNPYSAHKLIETSDVSSQHCQYLPSFFLNDNHFIDNLNNQIQLQHQLLLNSIYFNNLSYLNMIRSKQNNSTSDTHTKTIVQPLNRSANQDQSEDEHSRITNNIGSSAKKQPFQISKTPSDQDKHKIVKSTITKKTQDQDYKPYRMQKKSVKKRIHQNENRNVIPNQINQILSYLQKSSKSGLVMKKLWNKHTPQNKSYSIRRFYLYQSMLKEKVGHYSTEMSIKHLNELYEPACQVWDELEQRFYLKLGRALIFHFLCEDSIFNIMTSKRMKKGKKVDHLKTRRYLSLRLPQIFKN